MSVEKTVEALLERVGELVEERQRLRATGADRLLLERNRGEIGRVQRELSVALLERYLPAVRREAA